MLIIGCDFHPGFQQVSIFDKRTGEIEEKRLQHREEAEQFYRWLAGQQVRVGMEACGHYPWFERLLEELGMELWLGDAAKVRASVVRKQKTDRRDAEHLMHLLMRGAVSTDLGTEPGGAGCAAVAGASAQAGAGADADQEPAAGHGAEPGGAEKVEAVDARRGARSWSSCPCCRTRRSGASGCWKHSTGWKRRSASWTGEWRKKRGSGRRRCG